MTFDLLIEGGRVIDPANDLDELRDIGIARGRIEAVERDLPAESARRTSTRPACSSCRASSIFTPTSTEASHSSASTQTRSAHRPESPPG